MFCIAPSPASTPKHAGSPAPILHPMQPGQPQAALPEPAGGGHGPAVPLGRWTHSDIKGWLVCYTAKPPTMKQIKKSNFKKEKE